jgi:hypothetical protein
LYPGCTKCTPRTTAPRSHTQGIEGLPVIPIDVDIIIRRRDSLGDPDAPDCTKVIGWMVGSIIQVGRINSEGWDMQ